VPQVPPAAQGPDWFQVWTKDGRVLTYGKTRDALILARNGARASWLLQRVEDRSGNHMVVQYDNKRLEMPAQLPQLPATVVAPKAIFYGGNGASDGDREVRFDYDARVDAVTRFAQAGVPLVASVRLGRITTFVQGRAVKNYRVQYESETRSLIKKVFECVGSDDAICKPPTEFDYIADVGFESRLSAGPASSGAQLDINGDGIPDYLTTDVRIDGVPAAPLATAGFVAADIAVGIGSMYVPPPGLGALAVNGVWSIGKAVLFDALAPVPKVTYSTNIDIGSAARGGPFQSVTATGRPCPASPTFFLDYNQDGKDEMAALCASGSLIATRSLGDGAFAAFPEANAQFPATPSVAPRPQLFDVNGDALQDLVTCANASKLEVRLRKSPSEGFASVPLVYSGRTTFDPRKTNTTFTERIPFCGKALPAFSLNDLDGDGTPELVAFYQPTFDEQVVFHEGSAGGVYRHEGTYALRLRNTSSSNSAALELEWQPVSAPYESLAGSAAKAISGDFNGDGLTDVWSGYDTWSHLWLNTGAGFVMHTFDHPRPALSIDGSYRFRRAGGLDYDGDGKLDLIEEWTRKSGTPPNTDVLLQPFKSPFPSARFLTEINVPTISNGSIPSPIDIIRDVDGDGSVDLIGGSSIFYGKGVRNGLLSKVRDGLGNEVHVEYYDAYKATCSEPQQWPERCLKKMQGLVSGYAAGFTYKFPDGIGYFNEERRYSYSYENARLSMTGHGWLGFDKVTVQEQTAGSGAQVTTSTTEYTPLARYTPAGALATSTSPPYLYPLAGLPRVVIVDQTGNDGAQTLEDAPHGRRSKRLNTWSVATSANGRPYPTLQDATTLTFSRPAAASPSEDGSLRTSCLESNGQFDGYGNALFNQRMCYRGEIELEWTETFFGPFTMNPAEWLISHSTSQRISSFRYPATPGTREVQNYAYAYDSLGQLTSTIRDPAGEHDETIYHHDDRGNLDSITRRSPGETDRVTNIFYDDAKLFPVLITNPEGHQAQVSYSAAFGQLQGLVDPNGVSVQHGFDGFGRRTLTVDSSGSTVYALAPQPDTVINTAAGSIYPRLLVTVEQQGTAGSFGGRAEQVLDSYGRVVRASAVGFGGKIVTTEQAFDARGRVTGATAPHTAADAPPVTNYAYDYLDRPTRVTLPGGAVSERRYGSGVHLASSYQQWLNDLTCRGPGHYCGVDVELATETRKAGEPARQTVTIRDFDGLVVRTIDGENVSLATPKSTNFDYQPFGRLTQLRANDGTATVLQHDPYGRLTRHLDPHAHARSYTYNPFGEVKTSLQGNSNLRTFNHDRLGRVTSAVDAAGTTQWIYDQGMSALGQLSETISPSTAENPTGQHVLYGYEPTTSTSRRALLKSMTYMIDGVPYAIGLQYDDLARPRQVDYPDLATGAPIKAQYGYDSLSGALTSLSEVGGNATRFIWGISDAFQGQLPSSIQFGNGASSTLSYDTQRHFLDSIQTTLNGETIQNLGYQRYGNGQVHELSNLQGAQDNHFTYDYDVLGRLTQSTETFSGRPDRIQGYGYDSHGNLNSFAGKAITYPSSTPHLPTAVGNAAYTHDVDGNLASRTGTDVPGSSQVFTYTPFDLPATITTGTSSPRVTQIDYTADQQRVVRRDPDRTRHSAGDLYERVLSPSGATLEEHFRLSAGGGVVAEIVRTPAGDQTQYFHPDALGTPETLTDASGGVTHQTFDPFGTRRDSASTALTRVGYTGQHQDDDLGLIDMGGRVYDPLAGRFTTADPVMQAPFWSQGQNRYAYVFNDPINNTDPSGFMSSGETAGGLAPAIIGGGITGGAFLATQSLSGWSIGGGAAGGIGNVAMTLTGGPFGGSAGGSYGVAAPTAAPNANPVKPGGINALGQGSQPGPAVQERPANLSLFAPERGALAEGPGGACMYNPQACALALEQAIVRAAPWILRILPAVEGAGAAAVGSEAIILAPLFIPGDSVIVRADQYKVPKPGVSGKEGAKDIPSWAKGNRPRVGESGKDFAKRLLDEKYGPGKYDSGPGSEFNKVRKWGDRAFVDP
jgi:RHS repeat-associated protein